MLIVEDGSGVELANSYQDLIDARSLAAKIGLTLPVDDTEAETALINGALYLQVYESDICGSRTTTVQGLMFPMVGAELRGSTVSDDAIPIEVKQAQIIAANDFANGGSAWGTKDKGQIIAAHSVDGAVSQSYFNSGKTGDDYKIPRIEMIMSAFCGLAKSGGCVKLNRV